MGVIFSTCRCVLGIMLLALAIYTIYAFLQRKPNAVYLAKVYIAAVFISNVITLFSGEFEESGMGSMPRLIRSLIWSIVWFLYLTTSKQVNNIIPKHTVKYIVVTIILQQHLL